MFKVLRYFAILIFLYNPLANGKSGAGGVTFDGALGMPAVTIENPNGQKAGYSGLSLQGRLLAPIYGDNGFSTQIHGVLRYHDLENKLRSEHGTEVANHIGPGLGLSFRLGRLTAGYEYMLMEARHYFIGNIGHKTTYSYTASTAFVGFVVPFGDLGVGIGYNYTMGNISKDETGLSKDSPYNEQSIWFHLTYDTGTSLGEFAKKLVKP